MNWILEYLNTFQLKISEYFEEVEIKRDGKIYSSNCDIDNLDNNEIIRKIIRILKSIYEYSEKDFEKRSLKYDDYYINYTISINFEDNRGFRVEEKNVSEGRFKVGELSVNEIESKVKNSMVEIMEEYDVKNYEMIVIKIF